jgi:hypothetical protein
VKRKLPALIGFALWSTVTGVALFALSAHGTTPGAAATSPRMLPLSLRREGQATLVMIAHPHCPCTRASLHELEQVLGSTEPRAAVDVVVLFAARARREDRIADELRELANRIAGVRVVEDREAMTRLGAQTSGTVLFYDAAGELRFSGGITRARGHEGRSAGGDRVRELIVMANGGAGPHGPASSTPVFGCNLPPSTAPSADHS